MPAPTLPTPTPDELDGLIYASRTGDLSSLTSLITSLCAQHVCAPSTLLASSIDIDSDGLGSQSCLLHYPAANGYLEVIEYLLSLITPSESLGTSPSATTKDKSAPELVNHRNVSGNTPLHWAAMNGHIEVVKVLVAAGADPSVRNEAGRDCVVEAEVAAENGRNAEAVKECVVWMLRNCDGLERGLGHGKQDERSTEEWSGVGPEIDDNGNGQDATNGATTTQEKRDP